MNYKKLLPLSALLLFAASCNKSDSLMDNSLPEANKLVAPKGKQGVTDVLMQPLATYSQNNPSLEPFRKMFGDHFKYHATVEPWYYLPEPISTLPIISFAKSQGFYASA